VLIGGLIEFGSKVKSAQRILSAVADGEVKGAQTAWHCCLEFFAVCTRLPEEFRLSPPDALCLLENEILGRLAIHQLPSGRRAEFLRAAAGDGLVGGRIYDAHIAEIAYAAGAKLLLTDNPRHFQGLAARGVKIASSAEFAAALGR
jgi:hypothetical protein